MSEHVKEVTDDTFADMVLQSDVPVLVDFWAPWCSPCLMLGPVFEKHAAAAGDKMKFVKLNTDENPDTPVTYGIRDIPTIILFKNGTEAGRVVGADPNFLQVLLG